MALTSFQVTERSRCSTDQALEGLPASRHRERAAAETAGAPEGMAGKARHRAYRPLRRQAEARPQVALTLANHRHIHGQTQRGVARAPGALEQLPGEVPILVDIELKNLRCAGCPRDVLLTGLEVDPVDRLYIVPAAAAARATANSPSWWKSLEVPVGEQTTGQAISCPSTRVEV